MNRYAIEHGHDPEGSWILIVHRDGTSDITRFESVDDMWCCELAPLIRQVINRECEDAEAGAEP